MAYGGYPIYTDPSYQWAEAQAEDAWRRFLAGATASAEMAEAEKERARKQFRAREAEDISKLTETMAGRGLFFSGLTAKGVGKISGEYMKAWADMLSDVANRYATLAQQGYTTQADITDSIVKSALDYLNRMTRVLVPGT